MTQTKIYKVFELVYPFQSTAHIVYQEQQYSFSDKEANLPAVSYSEVKGKIRSKILENLQAKKKKHIWHLN